MTITREPAPSVTYFHLLFDTHQIVASHGCFTESFYPGTVDLDRLEQAQLRELFRLFPDLATLPHSYGRLARMSLRSHEARLIRVRILPDAPSAPNQGQNPSGQSAQLGLGNGQAVP
ncbi:Hint domain-containing protein [Shimia sp. SDUM112013]|uniref:Hint domain-containing protein n=1 Tax=Shimia sp. SDUM112013 TaxID=3136160 RepID=UPI0032EE02B3